MENNRQIGPVYHGTPDASAELSPAGEGGFFFTTDKLHASRFGENIIVAEIQVKNPMTVDGVTLPNPHEVEDIEELVAKARQCGHDSIFIKSFRDWGSIADTWVVFSANQIRVIGSEKRDEEKLRKWQEEQMKKLEGDDPSTE